MQTICTNWIMIKLTTASKRLARYFLRIRQCRIIPNVHFLSQSTLSSCAGRRSHVAIPSQTRPLRFLGKYVGCCLTRTACTSCTLAPVTNQPTCTKSVCPMVWDAYMKITFLDEGFAQKLHRVLSCACARTHLVLVQHVPHEQYFCV